MKRHIIRIGICAIAALLTLSCAKESISPVTENDGLQEMSFNVGSSELSRTAFDGTDVVWKPGDKMSIFDVTMKNRRFSTTGSGVSASFTGRAKESTTFYAVYPYLTGNTMTIPGIATVLLPIRQRVSPGTWADSVNVSMGKISGQLDGSSFVMKNVGGYVKIVIPEGSDEIVAMSLRAPGGEMIAGDAEVNYTGDEPIASAGADASSSISLLTDSSRFIPGTYYAVVRPTSLSGGLELSLRRADDYSTIVRSDAAAIVRNSARGTTITLDPSTAVWNEPVRDTIYVTFLNASNGVNQPFTENMQAVGSPSGNRTEGTWYLKDSNQPFYFNATYLNINSTTGLRMGTTGDYVRFPAIPGKRLESVKMEFGLNSATASYFAGIYTDSDPSVPVPGGEDIETGTEAQGKILSWTLSGTNEGEQYRLRRGTGGTAFRIRNLTLVYSGHHVAEVKQVKVTSASLEEGTGNVVGTITAVHPEAGVIRWGIEYRRDGATIWTNGPSGEGLAINATIPDLGSDNYYMRVWARADSGPVVYSEELKLLGTGPLVISMLPFDDVNWTWAGSGTQAFPTENNKKTTSDQKDVWDNWTLRGQYASGFYPWNLNNRTFTAYDYWGDTDGYFHMSTRGIIKLPAIPQYRLSKVTVTCSKDAIQFSVCSQTTAMNMHGKDIRQNCTANTKLSWDFVSLDVTTQVNTNYYLAHNSAGKEAVLTEFTLTYTPE